MKSCKNFKSKVCTILACHSDGDLFYIELYAKISPSERQSSERQDSLKPAKRLEIKMHIPKRDNHNSSSAQITMFEYNSHTDITSKSNLHVTVTVLLFTSM